MLDHTLDQRYEDEIFQYIQMMKDPIASGSLCDIFTHLRSVNDFYKALDSLAAKGLITCVQQTITVDAWKVK
jgi:hypothetical protein